MSGAYYRPHSNDEISLTALDSSLSRIRNHNEQIILAGDFNLPGLNWKNNAIKQNCPTINQHHMFLSLMIAS